MKGAEKEGAAGFVKGIGKGIGGLVLKPGAGMPSQLLYFIHQVGHNMEPVIAYTVVSVLLIFNSHLGTSGIYVHGPSSGNSQNTWRQCS